MEDPRMKKTNEAASAINKKVKYTGLNRTVIASFQPSTTKTPYIQ